MEVEDGCMNEGFEENGWDWDGVEENGLFVVVLLLVQLGWGWVGFWFSQLLPVLVGFVLFVQLLPCELPMPIPIPMPVFVLLDWDVLVAQLGCCPVLAELAQLAPDPPTLPKVFNPLALALSPPNFI